MVHAIRIGRVREAVANLYVLRAEMADVLQKDFGGRKVRFIGDCLHGLIAEGDARQTNERVTVRAAVFAAAGIRSSFELCLQLLPGLANLEGFAIGIELGWTPVYRIGLSGDASERQVFGQYGDLRVRGGSTGLLRPRDCDRRAGLRRGRGAYPASARRQFACGRARSPSGGPFHLGTEVDDALEISEQFDL